MKFIIMLSLTLSSVAIASVQMRPGKWNVSVTVESEGVKTNPMVEMNKAMEKLPPEQKKKMMEMMKGKVAASALQGMDVCYDEASIKKSKYASSNQDCDSKILKQTKNSTNVSFTCKDGTRGEGKWTWKNDKFVEGFSTVTDKHGKTSEIHQEMKFVSKDCGTLSPL